MSYAAERMERLGLQRCPMCPRTCPVIAPDGPPNSPYLFIGEAPGKEENSRGRPFIGKTGREFNEHYLPLAGLTRDDIRITNTRKCYTEENTDSAKFQEVKRSCIEFHLRNEILRQRPALVVPMGAVACSTVEGVDLDIQHGIPREVDWFGHTATTFPMWHPAAGLHKTDSMVPIRADYIELGRFLRGEYTAPVDEYPCPDYQELETKADVVRKLDTYNGLDWDCNMDTETDPIEGFWCLSFSLEPGTGYMIQRQNSGGLRAFAEWVRSRRRKFTFHNHPFDVPVCAEVDVHIPVKWLDDTMIRAYHLQNQPQGLKALAYRLCGMYMEEFMDVVMPYSVDVMMDYILKIAAVEWPKPEQQVKWEPKTQEFKLYKPQSLTTKLKRMITDYSKKPTHKVFDRWAEWDIEQRLPVMAQFGDIPQPSIKYVPRPKAIYYACRDADATGRVKTQLIKLKRRIRKGVI